MNSYASVNNCVLLNDVEVGRYCELKNVIIDKRVIVPPETKIGFDLKKDKERGFTVTEEGIVVVPKEYNFQEDR